MNIETDILYMTKATSYKSVVMSVAAHVIVKAGISGYSDNSGDRDSNGCETSLQLPNHNTLLNLD